MADQNDNTAPLHEILFDCSCHLVELAEVARAGVEASDADPEAVLRVLERELRRLSGLSGECAGRADPLTRELAQAAVQAATAQKTETDDYAPPAHPLDGVRSQLVEAAELLCALPTRNRESSEDLAAQVLIGRITGLVNSALSALDEHKSRCSGEEWKIKTSSGPQRRGN